MTIIELAGPPGSGKSTLVKALSEHDNIQIGVFPNIHNIKNIPFFLWNGGVSLPTFAALYHNKDGGVIPLLKQKLKTHHSLPIMEMSSLAILNGWSHQLKTISTDSDQIMILDQGPVYMLCELLRYSPPDFRNLASKWWRDVSANWANILDIVVCLDTSDAILIERIRARKKGHQIKENSDEWAAQFLVKARESQNEVLNSMMASRGKMKIAQVDTSHVSLRETVQHIFTLFDERMVLQQ